MNLQTVEETPTSRRASGDGLVSWIGGLGKNGKAAWPGIGVGSLTASRFSQGARGGGGGGGRGRSGDEAVASMTLIEALVRVLFGLQTGPLPTKLTNPFSTRSNEINVAIRTVIYRWLSTSTTL